MQAVLKASRGMGALFVQYFFAQYNTAKSSTFTDNNTGIQPQTECDKTIVSSANRKQLQNAVPIL